MAQLLVGVIAQRQSYWPGHKDSMKISRGLAARLRKSGDARQLWPRGASHLVQSKCKMPVRAGKMRSLIRSGRKYRRGSVMPC
jgi:hypothetical protein